MYSNILVPLDGSISAETVLPHVREITSICGVKAITLIRVVEPVIYGSEDEGRRLEWSVLEKMNTENMKSAEAYLKRVKETTDFGNVKSVHIVTVTGKAADTILRYESQNGVDLIIMSSHGRTGVGRLLWGSVADRVLTSSLAPVLMIKARTAELSLAG